MTISPSYQPSHSSSSSTSTSTFSSTTIFPSLSCYASPISESNSENQKSRVSNKKKKKDSTNKIIVTVRNSNGDELMAFLSLYKIKYHITILIIKFNYLIYLIHFN